MRQRRRGFFIIWGSRTRISADSVAPIEAACPSCQRVCRIDGKVAGPWFTLYFIPIFPVGGKQRFTQCSGCGAQFRLTVEEWAALAGRARPAAGTLQDAIGLVNELRETPADAEKLRQALALYLDLGEPREAVWAGKQFPLAAEGSDACLALLAKACEQTGDREGAMRYAVAARVLNPANTDAAAVERGLGLAAG
jgi:hypothetical protein